jgi:hypothetical protein
MQPLQIYIYRLERLARRCGVSVRRHSLCAGVLGRIEERRIVLRAGLTPEQELLTLVHELSHLLLHCEVSPPLNRTICEYEAEAVERWVGTVLCIEPYTDNLEALDSVTDGLLACSVNRVRCASLLLVEIARGMPAFQTRRLQTQSAVEIDAATGKEVIFNNELRGVRDFIRLSQPL